VSDDTVIHHISSEAIPEQALRMAEHMMDSKFSGGSSRAIAVLLFASIGFGAWGAGAETTPKEQGHSLDEQVQEIKSDALGIAAELSLLEEKLLYPSSTQVAVFVSLEDRETFRLDSMQVQIDGEWVAHHIYSFKELEALKHGGVQRIYTGNVATGEHQIELTMVGKTSDGSDVEEKRSFGFRKEVEPKLVEIKVAGEGPGGALLQLGSR